MDPPSTLVFLKLIAATGSLAIKKEFNVRTRLYYYSILSRCTSSTQ